MLSTSRARVLGGSWYLVSKAISQLGLSVIISTATLVITLLAMSHDPTSNQTQEARWQLERPETLNSKTGPALGLWLSTGECVKEYFGGDWQRSARDRWRRSF